jgi:hypothetical protein
MNKVADFTKRNRAKPHMMLMIASALAVACVVSGCSSEPPEERFHACFTALCENDMDTAYDYFVFIDRATIATQEFIQTYSFMPAHAQTITALGDTIGYTFYQVHEKDDTMYALISIQAPAFMTDVITLLLNAVDSILHDTTYSTLDTIAYDLRSFHGVLCMVKEDRSWYIYGNWDEQRRLETMHAQARIEYMAAHLSTSNVRVYHTGDGQARLSMVLHNKGDRALSDVELYIIGYTNDNSPCFTETTHPLADTPLGVKSTRRFSVDISQAPANWSGRVEVRILNCAFSDEGE